MRSEEFHRSLAKALRASTEMATVAGDAGGEVVQRIVRRGEVATVCRKIPRSSSIDLRSVQGHREIVECGG